MYNRLSNNPIFLGTISYILLEKIIVFKVAGSSEKSSAKHDYYSFNSQVRTQS